MLKTFVMPHMAPITETFSLERSISATENLVKLGGYDLLARFSAVVDMGSSDTLPQNTGNYYFVFGDVINGQALIIADALKFWTKELRVSTHKTTSKPKTSKSAEELAILEDILKELNNSTQEATIQNIINSLEKRKKTSTGTSTHAKTPTIGTVLYNSGKQDIVTVGRCVIRKLEAEIRSKKDKKTGQVVLYRSCDQLT